jgi:thioesterase domain-containing protein
VLIGHSLGGNDVVSMAEKLGRHGIVVDLLIPVDATAPAPIPANVRRAVNYFQAGNGWSSPIRPGAGFRGQLVNADLESNRRDLNDGSVGHISIDKSRRIHRDIMVQIAAVAAPARPARRAAAPPQRPRADTETVTAPTPQPAASVAGAQVTGSVTPPR